MKRLALALTVTITAFLGLGQMASAQYDASASSVTADGKTTVTYTGCTDGETITFTLPGATPETATALCADGTASVVFSLSPTTATSGTAVGTTSPSVTFTVASLPATTVPATTPSGGLPATGSDGVNTTTGLAIGALVVGLGLFAVAQVRRRQTTHA